MDHHHVHGERSGEGSIIEQCHGGASGNHWSGATGSIIVTGSAAFMGSSLSSECWCHTECMGVSESEAIGNMVVHGVRSARSLGEHSASANRAECIRDIRTWSHRGQHEGNHWSGATDHHLETRQRLLGSLVLSLLTLISLLAGLAGSGLACFVFGYRRVSGHCVPLICPCFCGASALTCRVDGVNENCLASHWFVMGLRIAPAVSSGLCNKK